MSLTNLLYQVFGFTTRWSLRAQGLGVALLVPVIIVAVADWRIRARR